MSHKSGYHDLVFKYPVKLMGLNMGRRPEYFAPLFGLMERLIAEGVVDPEEPEIHGLEELPAVLAAIEGRKTTGKQVFVPVNIKAMGSAPNRSTLQRLSAPQKTKRTHRSAKNSVTFQAWRHRTMRVQSL